MPVTAIHGCAVHYRVLGSGPDLVLSAGGRCPLEMVLPLAEGLAARHRVIVWDRANLGASDLCFDGASDLDLWTDQLHGLLDLLDARPAWLVAASSGARLSIRMALRYPEEVRGVFLWLLSAGPVAGTLAQMYYGEAAQLALAQGMEAVARMPYWAERIAANTANRQRLLRADPRAFAATMLRWAARIREEDPLIGVTEADLREVKVRTRIVAPGDDTGHRRESMELAGALIPGAELVEPPGFREQWMEIRKHAYTGSGYESIPMLPALVAAFTGA
jgi:pimeloyl-ACP methyl ester carboxylesterase